LPFFPGEIFVRLSILAAAILLAAPVAPAAAAPRNAAEAGQALAKAAQWLQPVLDSYTVGAELWPEINAQMQASMASRQAAEATLPALRALLARERGNLQHANAMLDALPPYAAGIDIGVPPERVVADARQQNVRMLGLVDSFDAFAIAFAKGDLAALRREMPKISEGTLTLIAGQRMMLESRRLMYAPTDSNRYSIGVGVGLYRLMEIGMRAWFAARDLAGAEKAAAALREQAAAAATDLRAAAAEGRKNLRRELAEVEAERSRPGLSADDRSVLDKARTAFALDQGSYDIADRLVAIADGYAKLTAAQLRAADGPSLNRPLVALEAEYVGLTQKQVSLLAAPAGR
jgi:hypothetical protein